MAQPLGKIGIVAGLLPVMMGAGIMLAGAQEEAPEEAPAYMGVDDCGDCHRTTAREHAETAHGRALLPADEEGAILADFSVEDDPLSELQHNGLPDDQPYWFMVIDMEACIGCNRCAYACQATNDTASDHLWNVVLHDEDTFDKPVFIPRPCMHCEHAPCVEVFPVQATYHREDGLVVMDYDRCIGCRYCMVACPYGARVFKWEENTAENPQVPTWGTPEVPRRARGVVEKCTFCIHRLDAAAERGLRPGYDDAATPACCVVCPTEARRFGDMRDPESPAVQAMQGRQAVVLRGELGTHPRVFYLLPTSA